VSFSLRRQFADVVPFDRTEIRVIIEYDLCFAILENRVYYAASASDSVSKPRISDDEIPGSVVETRSNFVHLNSLRLSYWDQGVTLGP
jgi:hypothetical protein